MVRPSAIAFKRWALKRLSPRRDRLGRIHTSSASSARSAANVWITSSSSTSVTCAASCRAIFNIITKPEHISHSTRIVRSLAASSLPLHPRSSRSRRWAVCIIATNVAPHDLRGSPTDTPASREGSLHFSTVVLTRNGAQEFHSHEQVSATIIRRPFPTPSTFLSKNKGTRELLRDETRLKTLPLTWMLLAAT